ncbi:MAG: sigma-70 family RNA polymerase sigma factor [Gemmatimonadota bacterium]|nr:sigma-70 family RNA polymerase sigma factor [Gemmatimonadota bacterium]
MPSPNEISTATDQEVVQWALEGSERAYRELVRRYQRPIFSLIFRMVRDRERAEDLAQETFVKALKALKTYRPNYKFSSWIFKIANNTAIDSLRRKELDTLSLDGAPDAVTSERQQGTALQVSHDGESPLEELEARELGFQIEQAVATLRPEYRTCILLRHVEGYAYEEIGEIMDLPLGTVKTYIHRARSELREILSPSID